MRASRISALLVLAALAAPAAAQEPAPGAPVQLGPPATAAPAAKASAPPSAGGAPSAASVKIDALGAVDPDSVGLIGEDKGGLGLDLWRGTARPEAATLLAALPAPLAAGATRDLERRLLETTAAAPEGKDSGEALLALRVEKLMALGAVNEAVGLVRAARADAVGARLAHAEVEGLFLTNDTSGACAAARGNGGKFQGLYWQEASAYCLTLAGQTAKASMIADLLREQDAKAPPTFFALMDAIGGDRRAKVDALDDPSGLVLSMMRAASRKLPDSLAANEQPAILRTVALSPNADLGARLIAAERAAALGALAPAELAEIESSVPFEKDALAAPLTAAEADWGPRGRALLLRAALAQSVPIAKAEVLQRAFQLGRDKHNLAQVRRVLAPALAGIEPAPELMWFAADAGRALYALGRAADANKWYSAVEAAAPSSEDAARAWIVLWPLARIAGLPGKDGPPDPEILRRWRSARLKQSDDGATRAEMALTFSLFDALGQTVPATAWDGLVKGAVAAPVAMPDPAVWNALGRAAADGRRGAAVALALIALGPGGPAEASPLTLAAVVGALRQVGLPADARAIALEAAATEGG